MVTNLNQDESLAELDNRYSNVSSRSEFVEYHSINALQTATATTHREVHPGHRWAHNSTLVRGSSATFLSRRSRSYVDIPAERNRKQQRDHLSVPNVNSKRTTNGIRSQTSKTIIRTYSSSHLCIHTSEQSYTVSEAEDLSVITGFTMDADAPPNMWYLARGETPSTL